MSAGTLTVTNGSEVVKGDGTAFTSLKSGDFVVFVVGGAAYTLPVNEITSDEELTLVAKYTGPTQSGLAWYDVPREAQSMVTAALVAQSAEALRGLNIDKANWQQIFSSSTDITITMPDGREFSGPSWRKVVDMLNALDLEQAQQIADQMAKAQQAVAADKATVAQDRQTVEALAGQADDAAKAAAASAEKAAGSASTATEQAETATSQANTATQQADRAKEEADRAAASNPANALIKAENLADVEDKAQALQNLMDEKPLPLSAPAINPNDAVTLQQAQNMGGATGPTQTGVMNFCIGAKRLHDSRNYIPQYEVAADGQLLNREDWPDLWAYAQMIGVITDSVWRGDVGQRGKYSSGDGTTTFRVPDLNGIQKSGVNGFVGPDSIAGLYGRGDTGQGVAGQVQEGGVPNIAGAYNIRNLSGGGRNTWGQTGSFYYDKDPNGTQLANVTQAGDSSIPEIMRFDASKSSPMYKGISEVRPNSFFNVWVIRASGAFVAANTSFGVMNSYAAGQPANSLLEGGRVQSEIRVEGAVSAKAALVAKQRVGGEAWAAIEITDASGSQQVTKTVGIPNLDGVNLIAEGMYGIGSPNGAFPANLDANNATYNGFYTGNGVGGVNYANEYMPLLVMSRNANSNVAQIQVGSTGTLSARARLNGSWTPWRDVWNGVNTTVDANGFIKRASPIVNIFGNGDFNANEQAEGATVSREGEGRYLIQGCLGLNSDCSWGGIDGGFEIPLDRNKQPVIWLDYEVNDDGSILVKTYHRVNSSAPKFAQNIVAGKNDGDPVDIPHNVYVSVRVQMPEAAGHSSKEASASH